MTHNNHQSESLNNSQAQLNNKKNTACLNDTRWFWKS